MECGKCHECCKLIQADGPDKGRLRMCSYCSPEKEKGCAIYATRPEECRKYVCMWKQMPNVDTLLRPDLSGIMFDKITDNIVCGTQTVNAPLSDIAKRQVTDFINQGFSVAVIEGTNKQIALAKDHTMNEVVAKIASRFREMRKKHGST